MLLSCGSARADFVEDSALNLGLRNFYYSNDYRSGHTGPNKTEEWGQSFRLDLQSGYTRGTVGFGIDALGMLGVKLDSGRGRHQGGSMLPSDGDRAADEWTRLGLTFKAKVSKTEARVGTLRPKLPILVANDGRLLPQTFQGAVITSEEITGLTLTAGKLDKSTGRASSDRVGLAVAGGREESDGFYFAGFDYKLTDSLKAQYYEAHLEDYYRQQFVGALHTWKITSDQTLTTDLRYFRTRSQGANAAGRPGYQASGLTRNNDGEIDNDTWSAAVLYDVSGHNFMLGYQSVSDDSNFVQLNQGSLNGTSDSAGTSLYLYTDRLATSFIRAGQRTTFAQYGYNFAAAGVPGLNASLMYLDSDNIRTTGRRGEESERDFTLSYVIQAGAFKGVGFTWLNGLLQSDVVPAQDQNRVILSYTAKLF
jgi:hypothetical protein